MLNSYNMITHVTFLQIANKHKAKIIVSLVHLRRGTTHTNVKAS